MVASVVAWVAEAAALALAPVAVVAPILRSGRALLVLIGVKALGERFGRVDLLAIGLALSGTALAATAGSTGGSTDRPLPALVLLALVGVAVVGSLILARPRTGVALGASAGLLHAASGVLTKEVGDAVVRHGAGGLARPSTLACLAGVVGLSALAQTGLQTAFQRANAATVASASSVVAMSGLLVAGFVVYKEALPGGWAAPALIVGLGVSLSGASLLVARSHAAPRGTDSAAAAEAGGSAEPARPGREQARTADPDSKNPAGLRPAGGDSPDGSTSSGEPSSEEPSSRKKEGTQP